jgi:hypothetical protein
MTNQKSSTDNKAQETAWHIGPRTLAPPAGASDIMRDSIANTPQPDPATFQIEPQSEAEWLAVITQLDEGKVDTARDLSEQFSVSMLGGRSLQSSARLTPPVKSETEVC